MCYGIHPLSFIQALPTFPKNNNKTIALSRCIDCSVLTTWSQLFSGTRSTLISIVVLRSDLIYHLNPLSYFCKLATMHESKVRRCREWCLDKLCAHGSVILCLLPERVHTLLLLCTRRNKHLYHTKAVLTHRRHISTTLFMFCWWHCNLLLMTSQYSHTLDINSIHGHIHSRSCRKLIHIGLFLIHFMNVTTKSCAHVVINFLSLKNK